MQFLLNELMNYYISFIAIGLIFIFKYIWKTYILWNVFEMPLGLLLFHSI